MNDACLGGFSDAAAPRVDGEDSEDWEVVPVDLEDEDGSVPSLQGLTEAQNGGGTRVEDGPRDTQNFPGVARDLSPTGSDGSRRSGVHRQGIPLRMKWTLAKPFLEFAIAIMVLRRAQGTHLPFPRIITEEGEPPILLPLISDVIVPPALTLVSLIYVFPLWTMHRCLPALGQINRTGLFAACLLIRFLYTAWLFVDCQANIFMWLDGLRLLRSRLQVSGMLRALVKYSNYMVCLPDKLPDLYGEKVCQRSMLYDLLPGLSKGDPLWKQTWLFKWLADVEERGLLQLSWLEIYRPYMSVFVIVDSLAVCAWVCALGVVLRTTASMLMSLYDDVDTVRSIYTCYKWIRRNGAVSRREALNAALLCRLAIIRLIFALQYTNTAEPDGHPGARASVEEDTPEVQQALPSAVEAV